MVTTTPSGDYRRQRAASSRFCSNELRAFRKCATRSYKSESRLLSKCDATTHEIHNTYNRCRAVSCPRSPPRCCALDQAQGLSAHGHLKLPIEGPRRHARPFLHRELHPKV